MDTFHDFSNTHPPNYSNSHKLLYFIVIYVILSLKNVSIEIGINIPYLSCQVPSPKINMSYNLTRWRNALPRWCHGTTKCHYKKFCFIHRYKVTHQGKKPLGQLKKIYQLLTPHLVAYLYVDMKPCNYIGKIHSLKIWTSMYGSACGQNIYSSLQIS